MIMTIINGQVQRVRKMWEYELGHTILAVFWAHSVSLSIGICQAYSAILLPQLAGDDDGMDGMDDEQISWIAALGVVTNPLGSLLSGMLADRVGRKLAMQLPAAPLLVGWLCIAFSDGNVSALYAGRLITGIAAGMSPACYTYVSEIAQPAHRGLFQALGPVCASAGILLTYVLGAFCTWRTVAFVALVCSAATVLGLQCVPESPAYLAQTARRSDAFEALLWLRRSNAQAATELERFDVEAVASAPRRRYCHRTTLLPFGILAVLFLLQAASGIYTILFYAVDFFRAANMPIDEHIASIVVGVIRLTMSIVAAFLVSAYARRTLCILSATGMAMSLAGALVVFYAGAPPILQLLCILANVLFSMTGMLPLPWILVGELFPLAVRSTMSGLVVCLAQCFIFIAVKSYPYMMNALTFEGTVGIFGIAALIAAIFCFLCMPETKNCTLEEIEQLFATPQWKEQSMPTAIVVGDNDGKCGKCGTVNAAFEKC